MLIEKADFLFFSKIKCSQDKRSERSRYLAPIKVASFFLGKNKSSLVPERLFLSPLFWLHHLLAPSLIFLSLFISSATYAVEQSSHESYAKKQEQKSKKLIVPYVAEVNEIIKNVLKRQSKPDIKAFKKNVIATAKEQCPLQKQKFEGMFGRGEGTEKDKKSSLIKSPIIIFVSFSMPKESIKGWIKQAKLANASVYIRGLVNNSFKDTAMAVSELVQDQSGGLLIDPNLFKKYSITQVPAVVVVKEIKETKKAKEDDFDVIYGDVSLDYALEKINRLSNSAQREQRNNKRDDLLKAIKRLRGKIRDNRKDKRRGENG